VDADLGRSDTPDETDADLVTRRRATSGLAASDPCAGADPVLLATLADAADAVGRLDTRAAAADEAVRTGLLARRALSEAAG
jgi:hypothetical protein